MVKRLMVNRSIYFGSVGAGLRRKSLLFETLREREGFANEREVPSLGAHNWEETSQSMRRSRLCATRQC
jgi:hypothetical protein